MLTPYGWIAAWKWQVRQQFLAGTLDGETAFNAWCELCDMEARLWCPERK